MAKIAIDMDGTIADFVSLFLKRVKEMYNVDITYDEVNTYDISTIIFDRMTEEQKARYTNSRDIYKEVLVGDFFNKIEPLDGAIEAVKEISKQGHKIIFLTKVIDWDTTPLNKAMWLHRHFKDIEYDVIMVDSAKSKHIVDVDVIIDDDPRVLDGVEAFPICIAQPWNEEYREQGYAGEVVKNMDDAVDTLIDLRPIMEWWDNNGM